MRCDTAMSPISAGRKGALGQFRAMRQKKAATRRCSGEWSGGVGKGVNAICSAGFGPRANRHRAWPEKVSGSQVDPYTHHTKASQVAIYAMLLSKICSPPASDVHRGGRHKCGEIENG